MRDTPEWAHGDRTQRAWANELARCGRAVLPTHAFDEVVKETRAPMMVVPKVIESSGLLITPDVLTFMPGRKLAWHEVKGKTAPTPRKFLPGPRWEHGFDRDLLEPYLRVQASSGVDVYIVVGESASPEDDDGDALSTDIGARLVPPGKWLWIPLNAVAVLSDDESDRACWPKQRSGPCDGGRTCKHGRNGRGGRLWDRSLMRVWRGIAGPQETR